MQHDRPTLPALARALSYRMPLPVTKAALLRSGSYPICPRCSSSLDREAMVFCDRCGQRLSWGLFLPAFFRE